MWVDKLAALSEASLAKLNTDIDCCCALFADSDAKEMDVTDAATDKLLKLVKTVEYCDSSVAKL
ncbi:hypothetical protein FD25_GL002735 [Levilactobacillus acidifarinae DSM 19394]|uniref:Uncharacterized protein n=1 Tax=Levilactobacillus acidifarinae DSM 19394 = JCM 15949 TaxID=1423715 RepID=A0A0R1LV26_9LACO|nr:hypothetical protein FD25_GL002735 [Levilactobacillus acidifarinae DSM 19394]